LKGDTVYKGYLVFNKYLISDKFKDIYNLLIEAFEKIEIELIPVDNFEMNLIANKKENNRNIDFVLFWDKDLYLCRMLENLGYRTFNSSYVIETCDDKLLTYIALYGVVPMPKTYFIPKVFANYPDEDIRKFIEKVTENLTFPVVVKECFGSFGQQVYLVDSYLEIFDIAKRVGINNILIQEYIKTSYGRDVRAYVVGNKVVLSLLRESDSDFRANVTLGGSMKPYVISEQQGKIAVDACRALGADFAGVDILFGEDDKPLLCEINSNAHFKNALDVTGINLADSIANYVLNCLKEGTE